MLQVGAQVGMIVSKTGSNDCERLVNTPTHLVRGDKVLDVGPLPQLALQEAKSKQERQDAYGCSPALCKHSMLCFLPKLTFVRRLTPTTERELHLTVWGRSRHVSRCEGELARSLRAA